MANETDLLSAAERYLRITTSSFWAALDGCGNICRAFGVKMNLFGAKGRETSRLRQQKYKLIRRYGLPENAVGGSLSRTYRRCGKATCHCASGRGHPIWLLTFRVDGQKANVVIPSSVVPVLTPLVEEGHELRDAVTELVQINARLVELWRKEQRTKASRERAKASRRRR